MMSNFLFSIQDDILDNILKLEQVDPATNDQDLNLLIDQLSSTVPHDFDSGSLAEHSQQLAHKQTSASAPPTDDLSAWVKDRVKKDNHNQSKILHTEVSLIVTRDGRSRLITK